MIEPNTSTTPAAQVAQYVQKLELKDRLARNWDWCQKEGANLTDEAPVLNTWASEYAHMEAAYERYHDSDELSSGQISELLRYDNPLKILADTLEVLAEPVPGDKVSTHLDNLLADDLSYTYDFAETAETAAPAGQQQSPS